VPEELTDLQRATLQAIVDTVVPSITREDDPDGFWARAGTHVGADQALLMTLDGMPEADRAGLLQLLDALAEMDFHTSSQLSREQLMTNISLASQDAAGGVGALQALSLFFSYGIVDERGQNPNFKTFGYPGPISPAPDAPKTIAVTTPDAARRSRPTRSSSAPARAAASSPPGSRQAGLKVVVLEAGGYFNEADFNQVEIWAHQNLYWRGGPTPTADMNVTIQAGSCLGGGTTINWTNSLRTKDWVRQQWADDHGLDDVATDAFDAHLDAVWERLKVNDQCSELNRPQQNMQRGAEALGWNFARSTATGTRQHDPAMAGYMGFGDQSGPSSRR
jgi:hypothetical protein